MLQPSLTPWLRVLLLIFLSASQCHGKTLDVPAAPAADGKALVVDLNEDHSLELLQHWLDQAMSGLMAAVATKKLDNIPQHQKDEHEQCSKEAKDVPSHARCMVTLMEQEERAKKMAKVKEGAKSIVLKKDASEHPTSIKKKKKKMGTSKRKSEAFDHLPSTIRRKPIRGTRRRLPRKRHFRHQSSHYISRKVIRTTMPPETFMEDQKWIGSFKMRAKRSINVSRADSYSLKASPGNSPFASIAKGLTSALRSAKNKDEKKSKNWGQIVGEVQEFSKKLKAQKKMKRLFEERIKMAHEEAASGQINSHRPLAMKQLDLLDEEDPKAMMREARKMAEQLSPQEKALRAPLELIREAVKLGMMINGDNVTDFEDRNLKLFSPRMMSVVPEDDDPRGDEYKLLSPSLFSLHKDGKGLEKATSLADGFGLVKNADHQEWLNFVMEASGVADAVEYLKEEKLEKKLKNGGYDEEQMRTPSGQPLYFTKNNVSELYGAQEVKKIDVFEMLQGTYTEEQYQEQQKNGYFVMTKEQLGIIYGPNSPYNNTERYATLSQLDSDQIPELIDHNIKAVSEMESFKVRKKAIVLTPVILTPLIFQSLLLSQPIILSPLILSPSILSPAIFGPVILGPWVFVPVILSPRAFSPLILNPLIFSPIILSPLLFHPLILSPGVFNPLVLSPLALSPFILSPQVFTPLILSPMVLNPLILTPMVGSPLVLSPFVLSPLILSPQAMFAVILSPYALSPLIQSELFGAAVVLSPSWLS